MAEIGFFPDALQDALNAPTVVMLLLAEFQFDEGNTTRRFAYSETNHTIDGVKWEGFTQEGALQLIDIEAIRQPEVNVATSVSITLNGVDGNFLRQIRQDINVIYGSYAAFYVQMFDPETLQTVGDKVNIFDGYCSMPTFAWDGIGTRAVNIGIDSIFASKNFAPGGRLNDADHKARHPGDRACELIGSGTAERIK